MYYHYFRYVLTFVCLLFLSYLTSAQGQLTEVKNGILDLRNQSFDNQSISLDGNWEFYWQKFLFSADFDTLAKKHFLEVPSRWRGADWNGEELTGAGYATYRLRVLLKSKAYDKLALRITGASNAYTLFINDKLVGKNGETGTSIETSKPQYRSQIYDFEVNTDTLSIVFHVSNFHYRAGGLWESIQLGTAKELQLSREKSLFFDLLLIGGIFIMGLYHFGVYLQRKEDKSNLYFSILCIAVVFRIISIGERLLTYFMPDFNWEFLIKIEFISAMIALFSTSYFFHWLFPKEFSKKVVTAILIVESTFALIFLLSPARISSYTVFYHNYTTFLILFVNLLAASFAVFRNREGSFVLAFGFGVGAIFVVNDVLYNMGIVNTGNTVPIGMFVFFFSQALLLSSRSSKAFRNVLILSDELAETNQNLEAKIIERTAKIKEANEELQQTVEELNTTVNLAKNQRLEIEKQSRNTTASINYAKRIQNAMLPNSEELSKAFPNSFVFYKPKDIVSGDFYWCAEKHGKQFLVVADCTGHGIPGAFMSLLGLSTIYQLIFFHAITSPEMILYELNNSIMRSLRQQNSDSIINDGMDIAICVIDKGEKILEYAGAHRPLHYIQNRQVFEIKGNKFSVGGGKSNEKIFTKHTVDISLPTCLYLFSDGYQDQFGGESQQKIGSKLFKEMLFEVHQEPAKLQRLILEERFEIWRDEETQIDDVLVVGVML